MDDLLTTEEVAEWLRQPASTLRYWRHIGKGPRSIRPGRRVLYSRADVTAYLEALRDDDGSSSPALAS